jgi:hypothetical protein
MTKEYFFPRIRSIVSGIFLLFLGLSPIYFSAIIDHSISAGFSFFASMFFGFPEIILGLILLIIQLSGIIYLLNSRSILRMKLDENGVYYLPWAETVPSKYRPLFNLFHLKATLRFIPYSDIRFAQHSVDKYWGAAVVIQMKDGSTLQIRTAPFTSAQRQEAITLINSKING